MEEPPAELGLGFLPALGFIFGFQEKEEDLQFFQAPVFLLRLQEQLVYSAHGSPVFSLPIPDDPAEARD